MLLPATANTSTITYQYVHLGLARAHTHTHTHTHIHTHTHTITHTHTQSHACLPARPPSPAACLATSGTSTCGAVKQRGEGTTRHLLVTLW